MKQKRTLKKELYRGGNKQDSISSPFDVWLLLRDRIDGLKYEHFFVLALDSENHLLDNGFWGCESIGLLGNEDNSLNRRYSRIIV